MPSGEKRGFKNRFRTVLVDETGHGSSVISINRDFHQYRLGGSGVDGNGGVLPGQRRNGENYAAAQVLLCCPGRNVDIGCGAVLALLNGGGRFLEPRFSPEGILPSASPTGPRYIFGTMRRIFRMSKATGPRTPSALSPRGSCFPARHPAPSPPKTPCPAPC